MSTGPESPMDRTSRDYNPSAETDRERRCAELAQYFVFGHFKARAGDVEKLALSFDSIGRQFVSLMDKRDAPKKHIEGGCVMAGLGRNCYTCRACGGHVITEDREEGTTPFMIDCHAKKGCEGPMYSACYRGDFVNSDEPATFIWRKPTREEYRRANSFMKHHFDQGGLYLYPTEVHGV
jgi:hypothetical protein